MAARRGSERPKAGAAASARASNTSTPGAATARQRIDPPARSPATGPYKLLAIDLDGTLLDHAGEAKDEDVQAIKKLKARGIKVTILTGRLFSGTRPSAELLGIDGPVGCADGSHVVRVLGQKTLLHRGIRGRAADRLRDSLDRNDLVAFLFAEDAIVHDERGADYLPYVRTWSTDLRYAHRVTEHALWDSKEGMTAVVALGREANIGRTVADIQRDHTPVLAALVGVGETVCVGDWLNDLPMLQTAGRSFAMGQSPDEVKKAATDVLDRDIARGGGIAEAIERAFGK
jgi:hydroxymethylpyrimidine pyrophosphatase-like HAD family hydrolase